MKVYCWSGLNYKRAIVKRSTRREGRMSICNKGRLFWGHVHRERTSRKSEKREKEGTKHSRWAFSTSSSVGWEKEKKKQIYLLPLVGRGSNLHLGARGGAVDAAVSGLEFEFRTVRDSVAVRLSLVALSIELFLSFIPSSVSVLLFCWKKLSRFETLVC